MLSTSSDERAGDWPLRSFSITNRAALLAEALSGKPSFIHIKIEIDDNRVSCRVENSSYPKSANASGIGQANLIKRLELLYPGRHKIERGERDGVYYFLLEIRR